MENMGFKVIYCHVVIAIKASIMHVFEKKYQSAIYCFIRVVRLSKETVYIIPGGQPLYQGSILNISTVKPGIVEQLIFIM